MDGVGFKGCTVEKAVAKLMRRRREPGVIPICLVAESEPEDTGDAEIGTAEISLSELLRRGADLIRSQLPICGSNGQPVAYLTVTVLALKAIRKVLGI
jgi:Retinitis pigmentosa G-protein regulator interacting C-terminal